MFNKKLVYSIRKLSIGIASVAVGAMLQTTIVHAQTGKTSELPPAATQPVTQPVAEDVEQPTGTDPVANTEAPVVNETAQSQPTEGSSPVKPVEKTTPAPPLPPLPPMGPPMGPPPASLPTIVQYLLENTEEKLAPDEDLGNGIPEGKDIPGYELVSRFPRRSGGFLPDGGQTANITLKFYYRPKLVTEVPNEAPQVTPEEAKTTEFETIDGVTLAEGVLDKDTKAARTFETYEFVETRETLTGVKHIYKKIITEVPNEAPQVTPEEAKTTEFETVTGVVLAEGVLDKETENPRTFTKYEFVETRPTETGVKHIYKPIVEEPTVPVDPTPTPTPVNPTPEPNPTPKPTPHGERLPETGEFSILPLGISLMVSGLGLLGFRKRD